MPIETNDNSPEQPHAEPAEHPEQAGEQPGGAVTARAQRAVEVTEPVEPSDVDPRMTLENLRRIVVGPAMQMNEYRLTELVNIMEEREAQFRAEVMSVEEKLNKAREELASEMRRALADAVGRLEASIQASAEAAARRHDELQAEVRSGLGDARRDTRQLSDRVDQWSQSFEEHVAVRFAAAAAELEAKHDVLGQRIAASRKTIMAELGRSIGGLAAAVAEHAEAGEA